MLLRDVGVIRFVKRDFMLTYFCE